MECNDTFITSNANLDCEFRYLKEKKEMTTKALQ